METKAARDELKRLGKRVEPAVAFVANFKEQIKRYFVKNFERAKSLIKVFNQQSDQKWKCATSGYG